MRPQPLISVTDVPRSTRWYQELLSCDSGHGGEEYERLLHDGALVLRDGDSATLNGASVLAFATAAIAPSSPASQNCW
jgi:hypothetical protein